MKCENCGNEHDGSYGLGRFCSSTCAHSFVGKCKTDNSKLQIGISVAKEHLHVCPKCNAIFYHKGTGKALCDTCKQNGTNLKNCKWCGAEKRHCKRPDICNHWRLFPKMIQLFNMDQNTFGSEFIYNEYDRIANEICSLYYEQKMSIQQIKELVGYKSSAGSFSFFLANFITFRNISNAVINAYNVGRLKITPINSCKFKTGFHTTWNGKQYFFRSSYEEDLCNELDSMKIDYEIETLAIQYYDSQTSKFRTAFPDFYIPAQNLIIEVKSSYTLNSQNMIDRFNAFKLLGYNVELCYEHKHYPDMSFFDLGC